MKLKLAIVSIASLFALLSSASAAAITFQFTGTITGVTFDPVFGDIAAGEAFHGSYTFDSSAVDQAPTFPTDGIYKSGPPFGMKASIGSHDFSTSGGGVETDIQNNSIVDIYEVFATSGPTDLTLELFLTDDTKTIFTNDHLPLTPPSLAGFNGKAFLLDAIIGGKEVSLNGQLNTLTLQAVPEPGSVGLVLMGSLAVFGVARRRRLLALRSNLK